MTGCECNQAYTDITMDHFLNPRHVGSMENPDAMGTCGDPSCGDCLVMHLKIADGRITDVRYLVCGCGAAIASSSMTAVLAYGQRIEDAAHITETDIDTALGGLPEGKKHCSILGATALRAALADWRQTNSQGDTCNGHNEEDHHAG